MGFLGGIRSTLQGALDRVRPRAPQREVARGRGHGSTDHFEAAPARAPTTWWAGRPLSEARNAHSTNTKAQFAAALKDGSNWFEGDVRKEMHSGRMEMRHDKGRETGDNLSLPEWLAMGKASGRGLKLDVKEGDHVDDIIRDVKAAKIPGERLMWNLGDRDMEKWGPELRKQFPKAILAVNPTGDGPLTSSEVKRMVDHAERGGAPVTFVVRHDRLTDDAIATLQRHGSISVWNDLGKGGVDADRLPDLQKSLRDRGVNGVIDLRPSHDTGEKISHGLDRVKNEVLGRLDNTGRTLRRLLPF